MCSVSNMADKATLKMIQDDIRSIKSQIDILRMESRAHHLETLAYLLDLAWQEVQNSELPEFKESSASCRPVTLQ